MGLKNKRQFHIKSFGGINKVYSDADIKDYQLVESLNCYTKEIGSKEIRPGYEKLFNSLGSTNINGLFDLQGIVVGNDDTLYSYDSNTLTSLLTGLNDSLMRSCYYEDRLIIKNGTNYIEYDGTSANLITSYTPSTEEETEIGLNKLIESPGEIESSMIFTPYTNRLVVALNNEIHFSHLRNDTTGSKGYDYFPVSNGLIIGSQLENITALKQFYNYLVIFKENSIHVVVGTLTSSPTTFEVRNINDSIGSISTDSIKLVRNELFFLTNNGIYSLKASTVKEYLNVETVSEPINKLLLSHTKEDLENSKAIVWKDYYILNVNDTCYVYDIRTNEWDIWDNINANQFLVKDNELYFGGLGLAYKFNESIKNDDEIAINQKIKTKRFYITTVEEEKKFYALRIVFSLLEGRNNNTINVLVDDTNISNATLSMERFTIGETYIGEGVITEKEREVAEIDFREKGSYIQFEIINNNLDEGFKIFEYTFYYKRKKVK